MLKNKGWKVTNLFIQHFKVISNFITFFIIDQFVLQISTCTSYRIWRNLFWLIFLSNLVWNSALPKIILLATCPSLQIVHSAALYQCWFHS